MLLTQNARIPTTPTTWCTTKAPASAIGLAEKLRQLPLSFFGQARPVRPHERGHEGLRRPGAHVLSCHAAAVRCGHFDGGSQPSACSPSTGGSALAALWPLPVAVAVLLSTSASSASGKTRRNEAHHLELDRRHAGVPGMRPRDPRDEPGPARFSGSCAESAVALRAGADQASELDCRRERRRPAQALPAGSASAPRSLAGALLIADGQVDFMVFFCFLLGGHARVRSGERHPADHHRVAGLAPEHRSACTRYRGRALCRQVRPSSSRRVTTYPFEGVSFSYGGRASAVLSERDIHRPRRRSDGIGGTRAAEASPPWPSWLLASGMPMRDSVTRGRRGCGWPWSRRRCLADYAAGVPGRGAVRRYGDGQHPARPGRRFRRGGSRRGSRRELR